MEREIVELFEAAKKAADAAVEDSFSEERCIDALKRLKSFPVTTQVLVSTQVGKSLRQLTKHPRDRIKGRASDLLEHWKRIVTEETAKKNHKTGESGDRSQKIEVKSESIENVEMKRTENSEVEKISHLESIKVDKVNNDLIVMKAEKVSRTKAIKNEKNIMNGEVKHERVSRVEHKNGSIMNPLPFLVGPPKLSSMIQTNDSVRDKLRELIAEALSKVSSEIDDDKMDEVNASDPIRMAVSVESVMFEKLGRSNGPQKFKYRSIIFNLKDPNNPDLRRKVLLGEVKPERLINMTPEEMASDKRKHENKQIKEKALFECERGGAPKATTDQFKCGRCGQRKTTYYQLQTRSADEPMTTFVTCVNCNNHWKFC